MEYSDYIVYVDESGDPTLNGVNSKYPVFVLAFCIFHKRHYTEKVIRDLEQLKFKHFGHDIIVMHEREILKGTGEFKNYASKEQKESLLSDLTTLMQNSNFILISCVVRKDLLIKKYTAPKNPYFIALEFGLERIYKFLEEKINIIRKHTLYLNNEDLRKTRILNWSLDAYVMVRTSQKYAFHLR